MALRVVIAMFVGLLTAACAAQSTPTPGPPAQVAWQWTRQPGPLDLGVTHTQSTLEGTGPARDRGSAILRGAGRWQDQHLMGFGTLNPEPAPGQFDWSTLDARMATIEQTGGATVLTAAVAPDWMKGGVAGTTDWSRIEFAPLPEHHADFADLVARAVERYPQIKAVLVWNELKGFYDASRNDWDAAAYTDLYNQVYRAVKNVRPTVLVGGPYIPLDAWSTADAGGTPSDVAGTWGNTDQRSLDVVTYWLANNAGADFVAVDGGTGTKDDGLITSPALGAERIETLTAWVRQRTPLPVWWAEFYPETAPDAGDTGSSSQARAAVTLDVVARMATGGASAALLWGPEADPSLPYAALWTDTADADGGRPTALTDAWTWLVPRLAAGQLEIGRSPDGTLLVFGSTDGSLVVNTSSGRVEVPGTGTALDGHASAILGPGSGLTR